MAEIWQLIVRVWDRSVRTYVRAVAWLPPAMIQSPLPGDWVTNGKNLPFHFQRERRILKASMPER